jgi:hypothetical protein
MLTLAGCGAQPAVDTIEEDIGDVLLDESPANETPIEDEVLDEDSLQEEEISSVVEETPTLPSVSATKPPAPVQPPATVVAEEPAPTTPVVEEPTTTTEPATPAVVEKPTAETTPDEFPWIGETIMKGSPYKYDLINLKDIKSDTVIPIGETVRVLQQDPTSRGYWIIEYRGEIYSITKIAVKKNRKSIPIRNYWNAFSIDEKIQRKI